MEAAFFAALNMLDKRVEFRFIPHSYMNVCGKPVHFVGERRHKWNETIVEGEMKSGRFLVWYVYGEEVVGFCTVGYQNLHIYLQEAFKLLIMPQATQLRKGFINHRAIVANVLKCRPDIAAKRSEQVKIPSIMRAEFTREREKMDEFRQEINSNIS